MSISRTLAVWFLLLVVAFGNGTLRQLAYGQRLGEPLAHQLSTLTLVLAFGAAILAVTRWWAITSRALAWRTGALWASLTVAFEFGLGAASGRSLDWMLADWALWRGRLWPLVPIFLLVGPALVHARDVARARSRGARPAPAA